MKLNVWSCSLASPKAFQLNRFVQPSKKDKALKLPVLRVAEPGRNTSWPIFFGASINHTRPSQRSEQSVIHYASHSLGLGFLSLLCRWGSGGTWPVYCMYTHTIFTQKAPVVTVMGRRCYKRPLFGDAGVHHQPAPKNKKQMALW